MTIERDELSSLVLEEDAGAEREDPITPGEILREDFMDPLGLSAAALARALGVPANRITALLKGERGVTADTALRLSRYFGTTPEFWMRLQSEYELRRARQTIAGEIERTVSPRVA
ncbi:addiction module antidote protein, HigA family [Thiohalospira halophila DSM 15071]|uniref:Addiction module antidote protein, HigA family n=1 Tax=Thiohalospira halophila DSM 15071 TaxID=1123397 RepID=A0A1I1NHL6_9GAMM|nr:HigA family addiction module antitoxin [Thiohalospira halophila]SFC96985.1 addiction module antidote protein, HigA family [Thiohalospira halophila DSM 15071]